MEVNELELTFIKAALEKYADPVVKKIAKITKNEWEKIKVDFDIAFCKYLKNSFVKYSKIKTILYRTEPKYIYDFFECPSLLKGNSEILDGNDIYNLLDLSHFIIVQGTGGIGKSTFFKHLFINQLSHKDLIPIFIELKDINAFDDDYDISSFIFQKLFSLGSTLNKEHLEYALKSGCFLFLLDGYDEILSEKKDSFFRKLDDFCDQYADNYFMISSRPCSDFVEFQRFTVLSMCALNKSQAVSLITKLEFDTEIKQRFVEALESNLYDMHESFASNPLLLNIMLLTFDNYAEIPEKLHLFYSNAFETLYSKHDATKAGYRRELKSKLSYDDFRKVFSLFCFSTYFHGKYQFTYDDLLSILGKIKIGNNNYNPNNYIYDLINCICVLYKDGLEYKFTHRSFQEYFAAHFLVSLSDDDMSSLGIQLIKKDTIKAHHDNVFRMLFDMVEDRFEKNILLPLLNEIENDYQDEKSKYDFYFLKLEPEICYRVLDDSDEEHVLMMSASCKKGSLTQFVFYFVMHYQKGYVLYKQKSAEAKSYRQNQLQYEIELFDLLKAKGYPVRSLINSSTSFEDSEIYELIKKTWIGERIETLSQLHKILSEKQQEKQIDLSQLLSL